MGTSVLFLRKNISFLEGAGGTQHNHANFVFIMRRERRNGKIGVLVCQNNIAAKMSVFDAANKTGFLCCELYLDTAKAGTYSISLATTSSVKPDVLEMTKWRWFQAELLRRSSSSNRSTYSSSSPHRLNSRTTHCLQSMTQNYSIIAHQTNRRHHHFRVSFLA